MRLRFGTLGTLVLALVFGGLLVAYAVLSSAETRRRQGALVLWHAYVGEEARVLEALVRAYNAAHPQARVRLLQVSFDNLPQKLTNAIPRDNGPDLFIFAHDRLGDWAGKGLLEPLGFWTDAGMAGRFLPDLLAAFRKEGALYAYPLAYKSLALFYDARKVDRPPATTRELFELGRRLTRPSEGVYGLVYQATDVYFHAPWLFGFGGRFLERVNCGWRPALLSQAAVSALRFAARLAGKGGIVPPEVTGQLVASLFKSGRAAMAISGPWLFSQLGRPVPSWVRVAVLPKVSETGRPARPLLSVEGIFVSRKCRDKEAAFQFVRFLTSDASARKRLLEAGQLPANRRVDRAVAELRPDLEAFRRQRETAVVTPSTPVMRLVWRPYSKALAAVVARGADPEAALREAQWEVDKFLGSCLARRECAGGGVHAAR